MTPRTRNLTMGLLALALAGCHAAPDKDAAGKGGHRPLVTVAPVATRSVPVQLRATGTVTPEQSVAMRAQVTGNLVRVAVQQGEDVRRGQVLFEIDPAPLKAALAQARATLARDEATARNSAQQFHRYAQLYREGGLSQEQYDQYRTTLEAQQATLQADRANVDNARAQLGYATLRAPIDGRVGLLGVSVGNLVRANDPTPLVTLNQLAPTYVDLTLPERDLATVRRYQARGPLKVTAVGTDGGAGTTGTLAILDNTVDPTTATFRARARFPNAQHSLWPGQFARVELTLATQNDARVVPNTAIQTGQSGPFVYLVKPDQTVEMRPVKVDRQVGDVTVVAEGLAPGERVVTDGHFQLAPGTAVRIADDRRVAQR